MTQEQPDPECLRANSVETYLKCKTKESNVLRKTIAKLNEKLECCMLTPAQLATLEESANIFASGAAHNKRLGRTTFAHEQQKRAEKLREIIKQFNVKGE